MQTRRLRDWIRGALVPTVLAAVTLAVTAASAAPAGIANTNPYPDGVLPVGDGKVVTDGPRKGYVYLCRGFARSLGNGNGIGGATGRGPWFTADGTGYRPEDKPHVHGDIPVPGRFTVTVRDGRRLILTNGLPVAHGVGRFPVAPNDPAYALDPNPNTIESGRIAYDLPAHPRPGAVPGCIGHQVGVLLRAAAIFAPVDAGGRDAVAWEVQDRCDGHPEPTGAYHVHGPDPCLPGTDTPAVIGFALDGFPITGDRRPDGTRIYSRDLDQCHGGVSTVLLDGRPVRTYRYVMTIDWPYTVSCFRGGTVPETGPTATRDEPHSARPVTGAGPVGLTP